jgi:hypothetical protein
MGTLMSQQITTAEQAYAAVAGVHVSHKPYRVPTERNTPFLCPHCNVLADHFWGVVTSVTPYLGPNGSYADRSFARELTGVLASALCQSCKKEVVFFNGKVIVPSSSSAPLPVADMPPVVVDDFEEARQIASASPRGAAALLRLVIQKLMPILGSSNPKIDGAIKELVASKVIDERLQRALDTVRVVGNEAVHPGELDLKDDAVTAIMLFRLVNFIVEQAITQPKEFDSLYQGLPQKKLDGIADRDKPKS